MPNDQPKRDQSTPSYSELVLVVNDIHNHAIAARLQGGDDGSLMQKIEELAETALARVCDEGANDTSFVVVGEGLPSLADVRGILKD